MYKKIITLFLIFLVIIIPVFASNVLEDFNTKFKELSDKFFNKESFLEKSFSKNGKNDENLITGQSILQNCADANTLFKVSSSTNAHAALWNDAGYNFRACVTGITITDRVCNADNSDLIIKLSSNSNAHVEKPIYNNYNVKVCSSDLVCNYLASCNADEVCVASISGEINAHVGDCIGGYAAKLCCKAAACSISSCEQAICTSGGEASCTAGGCIWDSGLSKCCQPGKIWDSALNTCVYDPNGITVILKVGESSKFAFNNELHALKFDSFDAADNTKTMITVSSVPASTSLSAGNTFDANLNPAPDVVNDFRVRLNKIIDNNLVTGSAEFTYIISDNGLCSSDNCATNPNSLKACDKGFAYCTLGTTCNFYPFNKKVPEAGCCPDKFRWNSVTGKCEGTTEPTCLNFNTYQSTPLPYEEACCQASIAYGFWYPVTPYN